MTTQTSAHPATGSGASSPRPDLADPVFAQRYRAMSSRDCRFDGQFITGVHSTGIYCRPSCPAATPKPQNVAFYLTAAAAHEAGLRACKRCLPDAVPGSPAWNLRDDLAARAMRLIIDGALERHGVTGLAAQLGYTPRHLTRVLAAELGAGPLALARAHRAQTARMLLVNTDLPVADVAFAAGFGSVRQFNDTIAEVYERTPTELRRSPGRPPTGSRAEPGRGGTAITLQLPARAPFDGRGVLRFLGTRAIDGVETATDVTYSRTLRLPHGPAVVRLSLTGTDAAPLVACTARLTSLADLPPLVGRVRRLLDLDADSTAIDSALAADPALASALRATPGIRVPGSLDPQETLFRALIGQQVSVAAARTALSRLTAALGEPLETEPLETESLDASPGLLFPTSERIAADGRQVLRGPAARVNAIMRVAHELASGGLELSWGDSRAELEAKLTALPGIGPWTAGYVALRVLGSPDILLTSDLAIRQGAGRLGLPPEARALAARGRQWAPWRSYAGMHLWRAAGAAHSPAVDPL